MSVVHTILNLLQKIHAALIRLVVGRTTVIMNVTIEMREVVPGSPAVDVYGEKMTYVVMDKVGWRYMDNKRFVLREFPAQSDAGGDQA